MRSRILSVEAIGGHCTVIESMQGKAKLILRSNSFESGLLALSFPNLRDCLEFAAKNRFEVTTLYSGRRKDDGPKV